MREHGIFTHRKLMPNTDKESCVCKRTRMDIYDGENGARASVVPFQTRSVSRAAFTGNSTAEKLSFVLYILMY